jgi:hypothetical protein
LNLLYSLELFAAGSDLQQCHLTFVKSACLLEDPLSGEQATGPPTVLYIRYTAVLPHICLLLRPRDQEAVPRVRLTEQEEHSCIYEVEGIKLTNTYAFLLSSYLASILPPPPLSNHNIATPS